MHRKLIILLTFILLLACNLPAAQQSESEIHTPTQATQPEEQPEEQQAPTVQHPTHTSASLTELILPEDLVYRGAFRLPDASGGSSWDYSGTALTWYPQGDHNGTEDGFPGSLFGSGHDHHLMVSEISIPQPVISDNLGDLNTAQTLQPFAFITDGLFDLQGMDLPRMGLAWLADAEGGNGELHYCIGQHFQDFEVSHALCKTTLSNPQPKGPWLFGEITNYVSNDYLTAIPTEWADVYAPGMRLASGRFREGVWGGFGPALFAYAPSTLAPNSRLDVIPLLLYGTQEDGLTDILTDPSRKMNDYIEADHWLGAAWLSKEERSALVFTGTKAVGRSWYGFSNGVEWAYDCNEQNPPTCPDVPEWPHDDRGYWAEDYQAQIIFYDPAELGQVALGELESWQPQPYAVLDITPFLYQPELNFAEYKRDLIAAAAFDAQNGYLYVVERLADEYKSIIHVWEMQ